MAADNFGEYQPEAWENPRDRYRRINEQEFERRFAKKTGEHPFVPFGIIGGIGALLYSAYNFRHRGNTPLSLYVIHTRVAAQGIVVGTVTLGVVYSLLNDYFKRHRLALPTSGEMEANYWI